MSPRGYGSHASASALTWAYEPPQPLCGTVLKATALTIVARSYGMYSSSDADTHTEPPYASFRGPQLCLLSRTDGSLCRSMI